MAVLQKISLVLNTFKPTFTPSIRSTGYNSAISLSNIYPQSSLKITTPNKPPASQPETFDGYVPIDKLEITYSKSTGPGGQNVNKVNTKVDVRFHVSSATWLSDNAKLKIQEKNSSKITKEGHIIFRSDLTRSQQLNLADCLEKLRSCIRNSLKEEAKVSEETLERIRKRQEKANRERLAQKRTSSFLKAEKRLDHIEL